jgi:phage protein|nr:MAG TPA: Nucleotide modification associated domain 1 [Caudoviricetes sp.]
MTDKVTPKSMEDQYEHQLETFKRKNHDYGNSFEKSLDAFGLVAGIVRMNDKMERLVSLNDPSKGAQIASESLVDTLEDLSNYAAMAACWLKGKKSADWKELRVKELDGNIESIIKNADAIVDNMKGKSKDNLHINSTGGTSSVDTKTGKIEFHPCRGNGKSGMVQQAIKEALDKNKKVEYRPQFSGIHLHGPEKLELDLNIPRDKWDEVMGYVHRPDTLPKNPPVKVKYGHVGTFEFPDGIDAIAYYVREMQKEEAKKENDRVMLDMMLSRIEKGEVVRIVANGDGSFTTYFEKTDGPFDKIVDKEDESIFFEKEGWDEEVKLEGQNGSSVTFTDGNSIFSFGNGVTARSLGDITLTAGPCKPEEKKKKKTLNEIRKEHGFDPVNGEDNEG